MPQGEPGTSSGVVFVDFGEFGGNGNFGLSLFSDTVETTEPSLFVIMVVGVSVSVV